MAGHKVCYLLVGAKDALRSRKTKEGFVLGMLSMVCRPQKVFHLHSLGEKGSS